MDRGDWWTTVHEMVKSFYDFIYDFYLFMTEQLSLSHLHSNLNVQ